MGNTSSTGVTLISGLRRAQEAQDNKMYQLVDIKGGGELMGWTKYALSSGDFSILDGLIEVKVAKSLCGAGKGKLVAISELVKMRNKERNAMLGALRRKKGKGKSGPNILEAIDQDMMQGDMMKALKMLDGGGKGGKGGSKYREVCWDIAQRGAMGENVVHQCLIQATTAHNELAKRLISTFPKLVNDIYVSEDHYGNSALHQAIVNEDPVMLRFLLGHGADVHQRCVGAFYCPDDQRESRNDSMEHEWVDVSQKTNYSGRTYYGEYPLSFAACTGQQDCFRLLRAKKADPNMKDTNGNTVLHLMVIHENPEMFELAHKLGAKLHITNNQNFTPLTLSAKMARKNMFDQVLTIERDVVWTYGGVVCAAYPLQYIDTIEERTGELNELSALSLIVHGGETEHLELLDGLMEDLLEEKWNAFAKNKLIANFVGFLLYFAVFFMAFIFRPYSAELSAGGVEYCTNPERNFTSVTDFYRSTGENITEILLGAVDENVTLITAPEEPEDYSLGSGIRAYYCQLSCNLLHIRTNWDIVRVVSESLTVIGVITYLTGAVLQIRRLGWKKYYRTLVTFPAKMVFNCSFVFVMLMIPLRVGCFLRYVSYIEHVVGILAMLCTSAHFLFFCRGIKFIGPFVLMVYKILSGDMIRFLIIYSVFVIGFSQSFFIIFLGCHRDIAPSTQSLIGESGNGTTPAPATPWQNILASPLEAIIRMFIMSVGEFSVFYKEMYGCRHNVLGKLMFVVFELGVSIMLLNLFIAMMARTYQEIAATQKEWKRQWAKVILMLEETLKPNERLLALLKYSRPVGIDKNKRAFVVKYHQSEKEAEVDKKKKEKEWKEFMEEKRAQYKRKHYGDAQYSRSASRADGLLTRMEDNGNRLPNMLNSSLNN